MLIGIDGNEANVEKRVGSNQYAFELLKAIYNLKSAHKFLIYLKDEPLKDMPFAKESWQYRVIRPQKAWTQFRLPLDLIFQKPRPDCFFSPGHYAPRICPMPNAVSVMDLAFLKDFKNEFFRPRDLQQLIHWTDYSVRSASHIFAISQSTKKDIVELYNVPEEKVTITYPGYNKNLFKPVKSKLILKIVKSKYKTTDHFILYLGTLQPRKNLVNLIKAFAQISKSHPELKLVVAGKKGWLFDEIFKSVTNKKLENKVIFPGFIPDEDVPSLMSACHCFVLPGLYEGFGIPPVEALACGSLVVVSNISSLPEAVGKAGFLIKNPRSPRSIASSINKALNLTPAQKSQRIKTGLNHVKQFSWQKTAKTTLKKLESLVK